MRANRQPHFTAEQVVDNYELVFDERTRSAHRACLEHAVNVLGTSRPPLSTCLSFGKLYAMPGAELAAFFGYLGYAVDRRVLWVDALEGSTPSATAQGLSTDEQAKAFGFLHAFMEVASVELGREPWA